MSIHRGIFPHFHKIFTFYGVFVFRLSDTGPIHELTYVGHILNFLTPKQLELKTLKLENLNTSVTFVFTFSVLRFPCIELLISGFCTC